MAVNIWQQVHQHSSCILHLYASLANSNLRHPTLSHPLELGDPPIDVVNEKFSSIPGSYQFHDAFLASLYSMACIACDTLLDVMQVANDTIIMLIGLVYCVIQPIIAPLAMLYFLIGMLIWKYQVVYVYVPLVESGGKVSLHNSPPGNSECLCRCSPQAFLVGGITPMC